MADAETPVGLYRKLAQDRPGTFLLESAEHGGVWSRYSIVGVRSHAVLTERDGAGALDGRRAAGRGPAHRRPAERAARRRCGRCTPRDSRTCRR